MVRKIFDYYKITIEMVTIMRYIHGDGQIQVIQVARRHHVSENFKIDKEWKKL
jgi:hypothetical protein